VSQEIKSRMLASVRERLEREYHRKGMSTGQLRRVTRLLDPTRPDVLTLGFARRFATYKRASLLLRDRARLAKLVETAGRPVLFLFAGKAHPADQPGQQVLREIKQLMLTPEFAGNVVFLEGYDMQLARWLVSGVDVWLNNPIAPLEASGTSGIKAAVNGRLNLSILDGWWAEASDGVNGWGIPPAQVQDEGRRDILDAESILDCIEQEVIPLYYGRDANGLSPEWIRRCKRAQASVIPAFNMRRTVRDYATGIYAPLAAHHELLSRDGDAGARQLAQWKQRVRQCWPGVTLRRLTDLPRETQRLGRLQWRVAAALNGLSPGDVEIEFVAQRLLPRVGQDLPALASFRPGCVGDLWRAPLTPTGEKDSDGSRSTRSTRSRRRRDSSRWKYACARRMRCSRIRWRWGCCTGCSGACRCRISCSWKPVTLEAGDGEKASLHCQHLGAGQPRNGAGDQPLAVDRAHLLRHHLARLAQAFARRNGYVQRRLRWPDLRRHRQHNHGRLIGFSQKVRLQYEQRARLARLAAAGGVQIADPDFAASQGSSLNDASSV
jgi:hypothetical protein